MRDKRARLRGYLALLVAATAPSCLAVRSTQQLGCNVYDAATEEALCSCVAYLRQRGEAFDTMQFELSAQGSKCDSFWV